MQRVVLSMNNGKMHLIGKGMMTVGVLGKIAIGGWISGLAKMVIENIQLSFIKNQSERVG